MRIKRSNHARDSFGQQLLVFDVLNVVGFDQAEHIGELAQLFHWQRRANVLLCQRIKLHRTCDAGDQSKTDQADVFKSATHLFTCSSMPAGQSPVPGTASQSINPNAHCRRCCLQWQSSRLP